MITFVLMLKSKNIILVALSLLLLVAPRVTQANDFYKWPFGETDKKKKKKKYSVNKYGSLIGIQRGKFFTIELGLEQQKKQLKLRSPNTIAWAFNIEYAWESNTLGYKLGGWFKTGRAGLTYGANTIASTDFDKWNVGLAPSLGFKLIGFHVITSYNVFLLDRPEYEYNKMHLSIRYFISRRRKYKKS